MIKTGRQVFKEQIFDNIDLTISVDSVISDSDPNVVFTVCDLKWLKNNSVLYDVNNEEWAISSIDYNTKTIIGLRPNAIEPLKKGIIFKMPAPMFKSGTPRNLNNEIGLDEEAEIETRYPIIWLLESIKGRGFNRESSQGRSFDFNWYALDETSISDYNNEQRHLNGVVPMSQLGEAVIQAIESNTMLKISDNYDFNELNLFGRESASGFETYILNKNLSGVGYRASVSAFKSVCEC